MNDDAPPPSEPPAEASRTADLAALGPFFAAEGHRAGSDTGVPWRSMAELADGGPALGDRVAGVRRYLAAAGGREAEAVEPRVAASVAHLGLVARVLSPTLALAVLRGEVTPGLRLADLRWQPVLGGPFPLSLPHTPQDTGQDTAPGAPAGGEALAAALARHLLDGPVRELADAFTPFKVSPHILWGNSASALNGAAGMLAAARPADAGRVRSLAALLLDRPPLRGTSTGARTGAPGAPFRRRSCCLIYRAAPGGAGGLCGDCVLAPVVPAPR
ncbi:(2Fe-2S)-binding protein [Streptomyces sp. NPDC008079]|uniref:(2Fe-2S)-binding protein n=1 Tax=Streptomyces sp. NPDC008079 TaxID=3364806 RepID=UPI0036E10186